MTARATTEGIVEYWNSRVAKYGRSGEATLLDANMRALEIQTAASWLQPGNRALDLFCGNAVSTAELSRHCASIVGLDLSDGMLEAGRAMLQEQQIAPEKVRLEKGNVLDLPRLFPPGQFDTVISIRGLINLPSWDLQKQALRTIHEILPPGGTLLFLEGSNDGLARINALRAGFGLKPLQEPWYDRHFDEQPLFELMAPLFEVEERAQLDTYFLMSRVLYPAAVAPEEPRFDHPCNALARMSVPHVRTEAGTTLLVCVKFRKR